MCPDGEDARLGRVDVVDLHAHVHLLRVCRIRPSRRDVIRGGPMLRTCGSVW
jgi:hypothetical protein